MKKLILTVVAVVSTAILFESCEFLTLDTARVAITLEVPKSLVEPDDIVTESGAKAIPSQLDEIYVQIVDGIRIIDWSRQRVSAPGTTMTVEAQFRPGTWTVHVFALKQNCIIGAAARDTAVKLELYKETKLSLTMVPIPFDAPIYYDPYSSIDPFTFPSHNGYFSAVPGMEEFFMSGAARLLVIENPGAALSWDDWLEPDIDDPAALSFSGEWQIENTASYPPFPGDTTLAFLYVVRWEGTDIVFSSRDPRNPELLYFNVP